MHLNETTIHRVKSLGMTEKGKKSEFLVVIGENAETTHSLYIVVSPIEYWILTTFPRERWYRQYWLFKHAELTETHAYEQLASKFPHGLSALDELPEERSGEVMRIAGSGHLGTKKKAQSAASRPGSPLVVPSVLLPARNGVTADLREEVHA